MSTGCFRRSSRSNSGTPSGPTPNCGSASTEGGPGVSPVGSPRAGIRGPWFEKPSGLPVRLWCWLEVDIAARPFDCSWRSTAITRTNRTGTWPCWPPTRQRRDEGSAPPCSLLSSTAVTGIEPSPARKPRRRRTSPGPPEPASVRLGRSGCRVLRRCGVFCTSRVDGSSPATRTRGPRRQRSPLGVCDEPGPSGRRRPATQWAVPEPWWGTAEHRTRRRIAAPVWVAGPTADRPGGDPMVGPGG